MRFYGGDPMTWLSRTPLLVLRAHVVMMHRLKAEESLTAMTEVAMGSGTKKADAAERQLRHWQRAARGGRQRAVAATPAALARVGVGLRRVPGRAKTKGAESV